MSEVVWTKRGTRMHGDDREHSAAKEESGDKTRPALTSQSDHVEPLDRDPTIQRDTDTLRSWEGFGVWELLFDHVQVIDPLLGRFLDDHHIGIFLSNQTDR
jgi:hypothetical protein